MENYLILKNNQVINKTIGLPTLAEGETSIQITESNKFININDYYLPDSDTYYSPLRFKKSLTNSYYDADSVSILSSNASGSNTLNIQYNGNVNNLSLSLLESDNISLSNFVSNDTGFTVDIEMVDATTLGLSGSFEHESTIIYNADGVTDSNNKPVHNHTENRIIPITFVGE